MALIDLNIPAGVYRTHNLYAQGRWRAGKPVRWHDGVMRPIGGWRTAQTQQRMQRCEMLTWSDMTLTVGLQLAHIISCMFMTAVALSLTLPQQD